MNVRLEVVCSQETGILPREVAALQDLHLLLADVHLLAHHARNLQEEALLACIAFVISS